MAARVGVPAWAGVVVAVGVAGAGVAGVAGVAAASGVAVRLALAMMSPVATFMMMAMPPDAWAATISDASACSATYCTD